MRTLEFTSRSPKCPTCGKSIPDPDMPFCSGRCHQQNKKKAASPNVVKEVAALMRCYNKGWTPVDTKKFNEGMAKREWDIPAKKGKKHGPKM